jgi:hypothetical protein
MSCEQSQFCEECDIERKKVAFSFHLSRLTFLYRHYFLKIDREKRLDFVLQFQLRYFSIAILSGKKKQEKCFYFFIYECDGGEGNSIL